MNFSQIRLRVRELERFPTQNRFFYSLTFTTAPPCKSQYPFEETLKNKGFLGVTSRQRPEIYNTLYKNIQQYKQTNNKHIHITSYNIIIIIISYTSSYILYTSTIQYIQQYNIQQYNNHTTIIHTILTTIHTSIRRSTCTFTFFTA